MATFKDHALCLRLMDWSDTSQIAVLFTEGHGKLSAVAKGAKRQQPSTLAKFSGGLELLTAGEAVWITRRNSEMVLLTDWDLTDPHWHLRRNLRAHQLALYAADLLHHLVTDHDPHPGAYRALLAFLSALRLDPPARVETAPSAPGSAGGVAPDEPGQPPLSDSSSPLSFHITNPEHHFQSALLHFQWDVIRDMGYEPIVDRDAETAGPLPDADAPLAFSPTAGGVVADTHAPHRWRVRPATIQLLQHIAAGESTDSADTESLTRANRLLCVYLRALLDKQLPTMQAVLNGNE